MLAESTITASLVAIVILLVRLVEFLVKRNADARKPQASPFNGACPHAHNVEKVLDKLEVVSDKLTVVADRLDRGT